MRILFCLLAVALAVPAASAGPQIAPPTSSQNTGDPALTARCKAMSFARRPPGQMATTIRNLQIERCVKNKGVLVD